MTASIDNAKAEPVGLQRGDSLAASLVLIVALMGAQRLIGFARNIFFCGVLEDDQLGRWSLAYSFLLLAAPFVVFGIPGSFGRYVESYRQRDQLHGFMRQTLLATGLLMILAIGYLLATPGWIAWLVFGDAQQWRLVWLLAGVLVAVLSFNVLVELLTALRLVRIVSMMQVASSFGFAATGIGLLYFTSLREEAVMIGYGVGSLLAAAGGAYAVVRFWRSMPHETETFEPNDLWAKLGPFATWIWLGNLVGNLFEAVDQFMLKHFSALEPVAADALVGQYYSSRIFPLLMLSLAIMFAGSLLPHLIRDWESGRRDLVMLKINRAVKLAAVGFTVCASVLLFAAPVLFTWAFGGKYDAGLQVLPGTLVYCVWFSLIFFANRYLLCAENARAGSIAFGGGLAVNIVLNYCLAPVYGLPGVVVATGTANAVALGITYYIAARQGMQWDRGIAFATLLPLSLCLGGWHSCAVSLLACFCAWRGGWLFVEAEKLELINLLRSMARRARSTGLRSAPQLEG